MTDHQKIVQEIIPAKLKEIEARENIRVIHCVESGSRAWGFASPDSDYDVRFIYVRPLEYYLRLDKPRDVIEWQLDETLDINGWDLQQAGFAPGPEIGKCLSWLLGQVQDEVLPNEKNARLRTVQELLEERE